MGKYAAESDQMHSLRVRDFVRHTALSTLAKLYRTTGQMKRALGRNRVQFLYLHYLFEDDKDSFRRLLERLSREHRFISYSEGVDRILSGRIDGQYVVFSFDDGLKNCLNAAEVMSEFGIKACFFACISMIGETQYQKIKAFCVKTLNIPPLEFLSWNDVDKLLKAGHEIGSHTMTHPNLATLSEEEIEREIATSFDVLTQRIGNVKHFAWPFGRFSHFNPSAAQIVFKTGFKSCASAERGCHVAQAVNQEKDLCIRRDNTEARWPVDHVLYLMARNSQIASSRTNLWPEPWIEPNQ